MQSEGQVVIDNESRELILVGHTDSIVAEAGQIYRGYTNSDHGIDGEIEFKDDQGRASGKRLYVQLKSGDSYLKKRRERWRGGVPDQEPALGRLLAAAGLPRDAGHPHVGWRNPLDGRERLLKRESAGGKTVKQIVFEGERFDVMSVRRWRDRVLKEGKS